MCSVGDDRYEANGVELRLNDRASSIDTTRKMVTSAKGDMVRERKHFLLRIAPVFLKFYMALCLPVSH